MIGYMASTRSYFPRDGEKVVFYGFTDLKSMKSIEFRLASLYEQTAIATVLSDMDAEIAALE